MRGTEIMGSEGLMSMLMKFGETFGLIGVVVLCLLGMVFYIIKAPKNGNKVCSQHLPLVKQLDKVDTDLGHVKKAVYLLCGKFDITPPEE